MPEPMTPRRRRSLSSRLAAVLRALVKPWEPPADWGIPLHVCERCGSDAVCPMDWDQVGEEGWDIDLRCGECGHWRTAVARNEEAAAYELRLGRQTERIEAALERLDRERMLCEVEQLVHALRHDLIDAADFAR